MSYGWGSDTSGSWDSGYSYKSARGAYKNPRTYSGGGTSGSSGSGSIKKSIKAVSPKNKDIATESTSPLVVAIDVTGSMSSWPKTFFDKLPLLYQEVKKYLPDVEISFTAVGDAYCDSYPLQVNEFATESDLDQKIKDLIPEGGGGGQHRETYELAAYYFAKHCEIPNAKKPIFIFCGDESFYENIPQNMAKQVFGDDLEATLSSRDVFGELTNKFETYILRKPYGGGMENEIEAQWKEVLGDERVYTLDDPKRIVDSIIGIVAGATGNFDDFSKKLSKRQTKAQVKTVMKSLKKGTNFSKTAGGNSVMKKKNNSKLSKGLD